VQYFIQYDGFRTSFYPFLKNFDTKICTQEEVQDDIVHGKVNIGTTEVYITWMYLTVHRVDIEVVVNEERLQELPYL